MRRILGLFLVFMMFVSTLASCKQNEPDQLEPQPTDGVEVPEIDHIVKNDDIVNAFNEHRQLGYEKRFVTGPKAVAFINDSGTIVCVGQEDRKTLDELSQWTNMIELSAHGLGYIGLAKDGHVYSTSDVIGSKWYAGAEIVNDWENIVDIACGSYHTVGLKSDGTVVATRYVGDDEYNKGQYNTERWEHIISVAAGSAHTLGLRDDGTVVACGDNEHGECDVEDWRDIIQISADMHYSAGLRSDGTVVITGSGLVYDIDASDVSKWTDIIYISVSSAHIVGMKADGSIVISGEGNNNGELDIDNWEDIIAVKAQGAATIGVNKEGTIIYIGNDSYNVDDINGYNLFTGEKGQPIPKYIKIPEDFPKDIPLYQNLGLLKAENSGGSIVVAFETEAEYDDVSSYYKDWCDSKGGYMIIPMEGNLDMLVAPLHDLKKAVGILVTKGYTDEDNNVKSDHCAVAVVVQGGDLYDKVANIK